MLGRPIYESPMLKSIYVRNEGLLLVDTIGIGDTGNIGIVDEEVVVSGTDLW